MRLREHHKEADVAAARILQVPETADTRRHRRSANSAAPRPRRPTHCDRRRVGAGLVGWRAQAY